MPRKPIRYADAGVSRARSEALKRRIAGLARRTFNPNVLTEIGSFGALYQIGKKWKNPVLVSSADGVGTKIKLAVAAGRNDVAGADIVNHCVNDIVVQGATPLFFLDYIAAAKLDVRVMEQVIRGMSRACRQNGVALIGGETAEMPGVYTPGDYDLVGFIVGAVERSKLLTGAKVRPGDRLLGLASTGLHTNGYSLARKLAFDVAKKKLHSRVPELGTTVAKAFLQTHRSYYPVLKPMIDKGWLSAMAHITGGGITENLPRVLPKNCRAEIDLASWRLPALFEWLRELGRLLDDEMLRTFNCGIGMILVVPPRNSEKVARMAKKHRVKCFEIGEVVKGRRRVRYTGRLQAGNSKPGRLP